MEVTIAYGGSSRRVPFEVGQSRIYLTGVEGIPFADLTEAVARIAARSGCAAPQYEFVVLERAGKGIATNQLVFAPGSAWVTGARAVIIDLPDNARRLLPEENPATNE